jgi:hypothetical protein
MRRPSRTWRLGLSHYAKPLDHQVFHFENHPDAGRYCPGFYDALQQMYARTGYQSQLERISAKITDLKAQLGQRGPRRPKATVIETDHAGPAKRRTISKAGRARIAAAQRAR